MSIITYKLNTNKFNDKMYINPNINSVTIPANQTFFIQQKIIYYIPNTYSSSNQNYYSYYNLYNYGCTIDNMINVNNLEIYNPVDLNNNNIVVDLSFNQFISSTQVNNFKEINNSFIYSNTTSTDQTMYLFGGIYGYNLSNVGDINNFNSYYNISSLTLSNPTKYLKISGSLTITFLSNNTDASLNINAIPNYISLNTSTKNAITTVPYTVSLLSSNNTQPPTLYIYNPITNITVPASSKIIISQQIFSNINHNNDYTIFYFCSTNSGLFTSRTFYPPNYDSTVGKTYNFSTYGIIPDSYNIINSRNPNNKGLICYENNKEFIYNNSYTSTFIYNNTSASTQPIYLYIMATNYPSGFISNITGTLSYLSIPFTTTITNTNNYVIAPFINNTFDKYYITSTYKTISIPASSTYLINYNMITYNNSTTNTYQTSNSTLPTGITNLNTINTVGLNSTYEYYVFLSTTIQTIDINLINKLISYYKTNIVSNSIVCDSMQNYCVFDKVITLNGDNTINTINSSWNSSNDFGKNISLTFKYINSVASSVNLYIYSLRLNVTNTYNSLAISKSTTAPNFIITPNYTTSIPQQIYTVNTMDITTTTIINNDPNEVTSLQGGAYRVTKISTNNNKTITLFAEFLSNTRWVNSVGSGTGSNMNSTPRYTGILIGVIPANATSVSYMYSSFRVTAVAGGTYTMGYSLTPVSGYDPSTNPDSASYNPSTYNSTIFNSLIINSNFASAGGATINSYSSISTGTITSDITYSIMFKFTTTNTGTTQLNILAGSDFYLQYTMP